MAARPPGHRASDQSGGGRAELALAARAAVYNDNRQPSTPDAVALNQLTLARACAVCASLFTSTRDTDGAVETWRDRLLELAALDAHFESMVRQAATDQGIEAEIQARTLEWTQVHRRYITLADDGAAREAALCLEHDGDSLDTLAARAHLAIADEWVFLDDLSGPDRLAVLGVRPGDLVGPFAVDGAFRLAFLDARVSPSMKHPHVRRRAENVIRAALRLMVRRGCSGISGVRDDRNTIGRADWRNRIERPSACSRSSRHLSRFQRMFDRSS